MHALVADGLLLPGGDFIPMPLWSEEFEEVLTETFRRLVLDALVREDRLTEAFRERLLSFGHGGGSSVYAKFRVMRSRRVAMPTRPAFDTVTTLHNAASRSEAITATGARIVPRRPTARGRW